MTGTFPAMPTKGRPQVAMRVDPETIEALDELARLASTPLREVTRSDVMRRAIDLGIEALRKELGVSKGTGRKRGGS